MKLQMDPVSWGPITGREFWSAPAAGIPRRRRVPVDYVPSEGPIGLCPAHGVPE